MTAPLFDLDPAALLGDVYGRPDFLALHSRPDVCDHLEMDGFCIGAAVRRIPGHPWSDLETPHGYGGPLARDGAALVAGLRAWRARQASAGRVAEFIRLHPGLDPAALEGLVDYLAFDRLTVMVDLRDGRAARWARYSKTTRNILRQTARTLTVRTLAASEWPLFQTLYEAMLIRHDAGSRFYFIPDTYRDLLAAPWARAMVAERDGVPLAAACFLHSGGALAHYHLSGGTEAGLAAQAHYPLLEAAFEFYTDAGCAWMHLGGGRSTAPDDGLWRFKAKFSPIHARFHVAGLVHAPERFAALGGARNGRFLGYR